MLVPLARVSRVMNRTAATDVRGPGTELSHESLTAVESADSAEDLLHALDDDDCRAILAATSEEALSASEVAETVDLPVSTAYRKLDLLTDAGLLAERMRLKRSGKHTSEYARLVEDVVISLDDDGEVALQVTECEQTPAEGRPFATTAD